MPLIRVSMDDDGAAVPERPLGPVLSALPTGAPVVVLVHGYKFAPGKGARCPHGHILSMTPPGLPRAVSWPRHLGFGRGDPGEGLCLAFGWNARGTLARAHRRAEAAGRALAACLTEAGAREVSFVAHSLGARVALSAIGALPAATAGRAILIAAAATRTEAQAALAAPGGLRAEVLNVRSGENTIFDLLYRAALSPLDRTLGAGLGRRDPRWRDLSIDCPGTLDALRRAGFPVAPPASRVCHWSGYLRPGLFPLYRAWLSGADLPALRTVPSDRVNPVAVDRLRSFRAG